MKFRKKINFTVTGLEKKVLNYEKKFLTNVENPKLPHQNLRDVNSDVDFLENIQYNKSCNATLGVSYPKY